VLAIDTIISSTTFEAAKIIVPRLIRRQGRQVGEIGPAALAIGGQIWAPIDIYWIASISGLARVSLRVIGGV
jgi:hypothetical protein